MKNADSPANILRGCDGRLFNLTDGHPDAGYLEQDGQLFSIGLTKREEFAKTAMAGLLSNEKLTGSTTFYDTESMERLAIRAVLMADALLKELKK